MFANFRFRRAGETVEEQRAVRRERGDRAFDNSRIPDVFRGDLHPVRGAASEKVELRHFGGSQPVFRLRKVVVLANGGEFLGKFLFRMEAND